MSKNLQQHRGGGRGMYLPVLLCFLPLIALNLAYSILTGIDLHWQKQEQKELAQQEVEALSAGSDFSYQFARRAGNFVEAFKALTEPDMKEAQLTSFIQSKAEKIFRWPFPDHELFVFHMPENGANTEMLHMHSDTRPSKRAFTRAFEHLVKVNRGEKMSDAFSRQNESMVASILGRNAGSDVMARTQRGRPTFAFYRYFPHWFLWEYFDVPGKGTFGFFLFTPSDESRSFSGKLLALCDVRDQHTGFGAFIPIFQGFGGGVYQAPLNKSALLKNWVKDRVSLEENDLKAWLKDGSPPVCELGNYLVFSFLGKGQSHLAILLMPIIKAQQQPIWLFLINILVGGALVLLLMRGLILGTWPAINLRSRFTLTYLLAATLPVSMLLISAYGYVMQYRRAMHFQAISQLQFCIRQFDARKAQLQAEYSVAFAEVVADAELRSLLKSKGSQSVEARDRIAAIFKNRPQPLPLLSFAIMDEVGKGARFYEGHSPAEADPTFEAFEYPIVSVLRKKMLEADPNQVLPFYKPNPAQTTSHEAYKSMSGNDLTQEIDRRRSFPITRLVGASTATQMHELIKVDGHERYAVFVVWDDQALDAKTFKQAVDYFGLNNPQLVFIAYRATPQGLEYIYKPDRHADDDFLDKSRSIAQLASFRDSYANSRFENLSLMAMPSRKYFKTIIVGGTHHFDLESSVSYRLMIFGLLLVLALIAVIWCSYLSARLFLDPITDLKSALDKVSLNQLDIEITSGSNDEIGLLCHEFSNMTRGLREREKLATLISDHAIAAISKAEDGGAGADTESFDGVALVSDIRNFTGMCEQYQPDIVIDLLNEHFAQMTKIISEHGGRIYKFIGDAIEAVFPEDANAEETAAERAFNAASLMVIRLMQINRQRSKNKLFKYQIGIGLAYGKMFAGSIGSVETRLDYAIIGEPIKRAAVLESCSTQNPAFPLVVDRVIVDSLKHKGLKFAEILDKENNAAFILSEIGGLPEAQTGEYEKISGDSALIDNAFATSRDIRKFETGTGSGLSHLSVFVAGVFFIALILVGIFMGNLMVTESRLKNINLGLTAEVSRLIDQIKCESAPQIAFENICRRLLLKFENIVVSSSVESEIPAQIEAEMARLATESVRPGKTAIFAFSPVFSAKSKKVVVRTIYSHGFSDVSIKNLSALASIKRLVETKEQFEDLDKVSESYSINLFGDTVNLPIFVLEFFGKAVEVQFEGEKGYFFYDFIFDDKGNIVGLMVFSTPVKNYKNSLQAVLDGYGSDETFIALSTDDGQHHYSHGFPNDLKQYVEKPDLQPVNLKAHYAISEDKLASGNNKYNLLIARPVVSEGSTSSQAAAATCLIAGLLALIVWFRVASGKSLINASVAAKLWLILLVAAVIPLVTVFFVSDLYLSEDFNARISQEKSDLQRFIDLFELRDSFATPIGWQLVDKLTYASETRSLTAQLNQASGTEEVTLLKVRLKKLTDSWHKQAGKLDKHVFNFSIHDIAVAGKHGWDFASSGIEDKPITEFGKMLQQIAKGLMASREQTAKTERLKSTEVAGEIFVEETLKTVRSLFGDDVYIRLSHGLGLPVLMNVLSGTAGIVIHPVPSILDPEFIMVWMVMFDYENYLSRIASNYEGNYKIFSAETHRYGTLANVTDSGLRQKLSAAAAMVATSNIPVSSKIMHNGKPWLLEGRQGIAQITSMVFAMAPEETVEKIVAKNRSLFNGLLFVSLLLILFIARGVAADILEPINSLINGMKEAGRENYSHRIRADRSDELGVLCDSFDTMLKGLEEKMLMGRMLSKTALKVTLKEKARQSSKASYVFIYAGIPDFSTWIKGMSAEHLIADLKAHVATVSGIIMSHGGDIDKIIGDRILAVFNTEQNHAAAVSSACRAALEIVLAENRSQLPFPVAIGINSGSVITGFLGVGEKRDFTVIGDAVNVTARIEGQAEKLRFQRCLISQNVFELVSRDFAAREFGEVELKGKSLPLKVYQLTI